AKPDSFLVEQQQIDSEQGKFLSLTVSRAGDSSPVQDALVTLYRKDEIYELQMTDASGQARFDINNIEAGTVDITITKHNYKPYEDSTEFGTDADPRLDLSSVTFTDVDGNGNNWCEPGEELNMHLSITNIGENGIPAGMEALLTGEENLIVLDTTQISISDSIAPGQTLELPQIPFYVNNDIRSDTTLVKRIHFISAGKSIGMLPVIFSVNLPNLMIVEPEISTEQEDTVFNSAVYLNIENSGNGGARAIQVKMQSGQKGVDITDSVFVFGNIDAGQRTQTSADFSINHTIPVDSLSLKIIISDYYGHTQNAKIDFRQPIAPSSFSFKPQMESIELNWSQSLSSDILGYQLFRKSPGDAEFYKITDQLISKAGYYVDKNVSEGETYQYLVRAVDSSYNISSFYRDTISAWPSVKLKPGFPIDNGEKAIGADNNGLAVYDFDGDDKQDIVVSGGHGVLKIYNNEGELQHSFENLSGYTNKPAIGNVFGDTRMEVVQSTYGRGTENNYIYIINPVNGQVIESIWLNYNEPSPIVLKDIDQDGYDDIITLTHGNASPVKPRGSRLMIWRSTGAGWETFPGWPEQGYYFDETTSLGMPAAADMTGDGIIDIIVTTCNIDSVSKVDGTIYSKSKIYSFEPAVSDSAAWIKLYYEMLNSPVSLADIDRDGKLEILIVSIYHDKIYTLNHRGEEFPGWQSGIKVGAANPWYIGSPAIPANLDPADPQLEIAYAGRDSLYVFQHSGEKMANWPIAIHNGDNFFDEQHGKISVNSSPVIADLDQDGIYEIICVTNDGLIHAFNAKTTKEIPGFPVNSYNDEIRSESPLVSDVDHDGDLDLLYADHSGKLFFWDVNIPYTNGSLLCWSQPFSNFRHTGELDSLKLGPLSSVRHADANRTPDLYYLRHNYPNPFNPSTTIEFGLNNPAIVKLTIFNLLGQEIISLTDGAYSTGKHQIRWNGRNKNGVYVSSGIYIYRLLVKEPQTGKTLFHKQHKMILLK
ncbi:MAG: FG-GAP-like repeat-containing protein, partial [Calditrichaceae bacterium]